MSTSEEKSFCKLQEQSFTGQHFRSEAISAIEKAINQRKAVIKLKKSFLRLTNDHYRVFTLYEVHKKDWTIRGVARFIIANSRYLLELIPWTNRPAIDNMKYLIAAAAKFQNYAG
jgi:hypothetical protein